MNEQVGLWIDHRKTVIVTFDNEIETTRSIRSHMEKHVRFSSGGGPRNSGGIQGSPAEDVRDRQFEGHLDRYYDEIIAIIRDADSIWIIGPGEAKVELSNRLKSEELGGRIVGIETVDKMTDRQIAALVRDHYGKKGGKK
ncbi:MAG TPA: hypothetical protein VMS73_03635 [Anaerolineaceae bacterium]|nr:hypothetical protein [Anaerolineaceae bacterium]